MFLTLQFTVLCNVLGMAVYEIQHFSGLVAQFSHVFSRFQ